MLRSDRHNRLNREDEALQGDVRTVFDDDDNAFDVSLFSTKNARFLSDSALTLEDFLTKTSSWPTDFTIDAMYSFRLGLLD